MKFQMTDFILGFIIGWFFDDIRTLIKRVYEEAKIAKRDWRKK
jgi:hypothetical protein